MSNCHVWVSCREVLLKYGEGLVLVRLCIVAYINVFEWPTYLPRIHTDDQTNISFCDDTAHCKWVVKDSLEYFTLLTRSPGRYI